MEFIEGVGEWLALIFGYVDAQDACELAGEPGHAAFQPVGVVFGDSGGEGLDQTRAVGADHGQD